MKTSIHAITLAICFTASQGWGQGSLIARHIGDTDPTSEGFNLSLGGSPSLVPVTNDLGLNAWQVGWDFGTDFGQYAYWLSESEKAALQAGWTLSINLRILQPFSGPQNGLFAQVSMGIAFGTQLDGDPVVRVGSTEFIFDGAGSGYHTYQLVHDNPTKLASLWMDGNLVATGIPGTSFEATNLEWGGGQHPPGSANANWHEVSLWAIPEPSALTLLLLGSGAAACLRMRRVKRRRNQV